MTSRIFLACAVILIAPLRPYAQPNAQRLREERAAKIETILRIKDLRTPHDGSLMQLLSDPDPVVRREATFAFGSIQDSTALAPLTRNLTDASLATQLAAAFALGQTGMILSEEGRQSLAHDLIWYRLPTTLAVGPLIEEIGRFGLEDALNDLLVRYANQHDNTLRTALVMSVARFAERGLTSDDAVRYLLRYIHPAELTPREVAYALRRVGKHHLLSEEIESVALLWRHPDAEVRMQVATLLGALGNVAVASYPLMTLARHDRDWRVRVNAVRALGQLPVGGDDAAMDLFRELFFDRNLHVAITTLSALPGTGIAPDSTRAIVTETLHQLRLIAQNRSDNFPWQLQAEAADALAAIEGAGAFPTLRHVRASHPRLEERLLVALGRTGSDAATALLLDAVREEDPPFHAAALEGLAELSQRRTADTLLTERVSQALIGSLRSDDPAVQGTAAILLREARFDGRAATPALVSAAGDLHVPSDTEVLLEMIRTLGALEDTRAVPFLYNQLGNPDGVIRIAAAQALQHITGQVYALPQRDGALVTDFDFSMLRALPDTVRVDLETTAGVIGLELYTRIAPFTIMNILKLEEQRGYFDGIRFHRVVPNFVIQAGDPRGDGWGGPGWTIRSEFSSRSFEQGTIGMASAGKDTEGSQFFITHSWQPHLDGRYTLFGRVVSGQDVVDRIQVDDRILTLRRVDATVH